jgi:hypothetical protein
MQKYTFFSKPHAEKVLNSLKAAEGRSFRFNRVQLPAKSCATFGEKL